MKKNLLFFVFGLTIAGLLSFTIINNNNEAVVNEYEGVLIFTDSKPINENYDVVDGISLGVISGGKEYYYQKKRIIKLAKEKGKDFDAVIFEIDSKKSIQGSLIKFK